MAPSPIVELNHAVALAMTQGPEVALGVVEGLAREGRLDGYYLLHATWADLLSRCGRTTEADDSLRTAIDWPRRMPNAVY